MYTYHLTVIYLVKGKIEKKINYFFEYPHIKWLIR